MVKVASPASREGPRSTRRKVSSVEGEEKRCRRCTVFNVSDWALTAGARVVSIGSAGAVALAVSDDSIRVGSGLEQAPKTDSSKAEKRT